MIPRIPTLYVWGAVALAFLALGTFAGCEHSNAKAARAERAQWQHAATTALEANETNQRTIERLRSALDLWQRLAKPAEEIHVKAAQADEYAAALRAAWNELDELKRRDRENQECDALLRVDFGKRCAGLGRELRERAAGGQGNRAGRDPGPGPGAAPVEPHGRLRAALPLPGGLAHR